MIIVVIVINVVIMTSALTMIDVLIMISDYD